MAKIKLNKQSWVNILLIVLACVLVIGALVGGLSLFVKNAEKTQNTISASAFSVGGLDANGKYKKTSASIYTKQMFDCQGLQVTTSEDSNVSYQLYFYDNEENFVSKTGVLTENYDEPIALNVWKCRVVITPKDDQKVNWWEVNKYAKRLTIKTDMTQYKTLGERIENAKNLPNIAELNGVGTWDAENWQFIERAETPFYFMKSIDTNNLNSVIIKVKTSTLTGKVQFANMDFDAMLFYADNDNIADFDYDVLVADNDISYISVNVADYSKITFSVDSASADIVEVYAM